MLHEEIDADEDYANDERDLDNSFSTMKQHVRCAPSTRRKFMMG